MRNDGHGKAEQHSGAHRHVTPLVRLLGLFRLELADILALTLFGLTAGFLSLATPLAIEWVVTTVGFGRYLQPLLVLAIILFVFLGFLSTMRILQSLVVEIIQRRLLVRFVGDLSFRLPFVKLKELEGVYGPELLNRFFDIVTLQKLLASLLLDGISLVLSTITGMLLLAFYHPFLLGYDVILLLCMTLITWILGRGAIQTAIDESLVKYRVAFWLQQVIAYPTAFRLHGGNQLAVQNANSLTLEYLEARKRHFQILLRQIVFAGGLQAVASTALLGIGGWLVLREQLTLGQLVASELVVSVIVGAFAKVGKTLENYYDMMSSLDKIGHVLDLSSEANRNALSTQSGCAALRWNELNIRIADGHGILDCGHGQIEAGQHAAIRGCDIEVASNFLKGLACLLPLEHGFAEIEKHAIADASMALHDPWLGYVGDIEIFDGTIQDNLQLGRNAIPPQNIRGVLADLGIWDAIASLPEGMQTVLHGRGHLLSHDQRVKLMIARAIVGNPRVLLIDRALDALVPSSREALEGYLLADDAPWTCVLATALPHLSHPIFELQLQAEVKS